MRVVLVWLDAPHFDARDPGCRKRGHQPTTRAQAGQVMRFVTLVQCSGHALLLPLPGAWIQIASPHIVYRDPRVDLA